MPSWNAIKRSGNLNDREWCQCPALRCKVGATEARPACPQPYLRRDRRDEGHQPGAVQTRKVKSDQPLDDRGGVLENMYHLRMPCRLLRGR
jgi:hypothetical protein